MEPQKEEDKPFYPKSKFGANSTADQVARDITLQDKNTIVTGSNTGIGKETARVLCKMGANVFMACRDIQKAESAKIDILKEIGENFSEKLHVMGCDLGSFASIRAFVDEWNKLDIPLHILINNAGVMSCPRSTTVDGFETQFGVNHLAHFLLTNLLLPSLRKAGTARVVNVSSIAHNGVGIRFDVCGKTDIYNEFLGNWKAYSISKTANILFSNELDRRYKDEGIRSNALHPGAIGTDLGRNNIFAGIFYTLAHVFIKSIPQGAATTVYVATAPELESIGGKYFEDCKLAPPATHAKSEKDAQQLWELSLKWVGLPRKFGCSS